MNASDEDQPGNGVRLQALVETMNRAADEEKRLLSSTRRVVTRLSIAKLMFAARRARASFFDAELLGEPAWDVVLFLYIAYREGRPVRIEAAIAASQMKPTVARRWIDILIDKGLIEPIALPCGHLRSEESTQFLYLADKAVAAVESTIDHYLTTGAEYL